MISLDTCIQRDTSYQSYFKSVLEIKVVGRGLYRLEFYFYVFGYFSGWLIYKKRIRGRVKQESSYQNEIILGPLIVTDEKVFSRKLLSDGLPRDVTDGGL